MSNGWFSLMDMAIVGVPAFGFGIWQLVSVNRELKRDRATREASERAAGHAVGQHGEHDGRAEAPE